MEVVTDIKTLQTLLKPFRDKKEAVGMVPTMGALHQGHLSLVKRAITENKIVVVSIFVNPTQFNNPADLAKYPVGLPADVTLLETLNAPLVVFAPSPAEIYPEGLQSKNFEFNGLDLLWEGADRPGHFKGVATVVEKLFKAVTPSQAYFGEKDFQQLAIIKHLTQLHQWPVKIIGCPIIREKNGLAMSSRNERLLKKDREAASIIYKTLQKAAIDFYKHPIAQVKQEAHKTLSSLEGLEMAYFEFVSATTLEALKDPEQPEKKRLLIAVTYGGVRLLDNIGLERPKNI